MKGLVHLQSRKLRQGPLHNVYMASGKVKQSEMGSTGFTIGESGDGGEPEI